MRVDDIGPRTWLLAGLVAWALVGWLLAVAGMGSRVGTLTDDPALLVALPSSASAPAAVLGPAEQYAEIAARPLFAADRRPHPFFLEGGDEEARSEGFDYVLTSVLITPWLKLAIIQPSDGTDSLRVKLDQSVDPQSAWRLVELDARSAVFEGPEGRRTLPLRVFEGVGREPSGGSTGGVPAPAPAAPESNGNVKPADPRAPGASSGGETIKPSASPATDAASAAPAAEREQMDAIRQRIEARRAQLRDQSPPPPPPANGR
ncbi:MAG: hypothetical protein ACOH1P_09605 [Lysobacter sp.]